MPGSNRIGESSREEARIENGNGGLLSTGGGLSSLGHSRLDYFEEVGGIEGFV